MNKLAFQKKYYRFFLFLTSFYMMFETSFAFEHHDSHVHFYEYKKNIIQENRKHQKPFFLLFAAEWCHWCEIFAEETLTKKKIYSYLNKNFINIFIDADIHSGTYKKYKANGVPYTVFLNPDTSIYYKYSGTLYAEPFFEVIEDVVKNIQKGLDVDGDDILPFEYSPPKEFNKYSIEKLKRTFINGFLDNLDWKEYGLGKREKTILPDAFLYFLNECNGEDKEDVVLWISKTLSKAINNIYDPVEGGFFRFAETRDWDIPHYEKMAGLNAGLVLLLYKVDKVKPNKSFKNAAEQTVKYLSDTLYDEKTGSFLSFQEADTYYYFFNKKQRKKQKFPHVIKNIYTTHLAITLNYLIDVLDYTDDYSLKNKLLNSIDFLSKMISNNEVFYHYYSTTSKKWTGKGDLKDYSLLAKLFHRASKKFQNIRYKQIALKILKYSISQFYNKEKFIFVDPELDEDDYEYLMRINSIYASILLESNSNNIYNVQVSAKPIITYFSELNELLEDRFWEGKNWEILENYAIYLETTDQFLAKKSKF